MQVKHYSESSHQTSEWQKKKCNVIAMTLLHGYLVFHQMLISREFYMQQYPQKGVEKKKNIQQAADLQVETPY